MVVVALARQAAGFFSDRDGTVKGKVPTEVSAGGILLLLLGALSKK